MHSFQKSLLSADILVALHGGDGAVGAGCHHLTQGGHPHVAGGKYTGDVGTHTLVGLDVAALHVQNAVEHPGGLFAGEAEQAEEAVLLIGMEHRLLAGLGVLQDDLAEQLIAAHVLHLFIAQNVDLGLGV